MNEKKFQCFLIIKKINYENSLFSIDYDFFGIEDIVDFLKRNNWHSVENNRIVIIKENYLVWIKSIKFEDFRILEFVTNNFFDDEAYCFEVFSNFFSHKASEIKLLN